EKEKIRPLPNTPFGFVALSHVHANPPLVPSIRVHYARRRGHARRYRRHRLSPALPRVGGLAATQAADGARDARGAWARARTLLLVSEHGQHHQRSALRNADHVARRRDPRT